MRAYLSPDCGGAGRVAPPGLDAAASWIRDRRAVAGDAFPRSAVSAVTFCALVRFGPVELCAVFRWPPVEP